jgi:hypothetical protein
MNANSNTHCAIRCPGPYPTLNRTTKKRCFLVASALRASAAADGQRYASVGQVAMHPVK